MQFGGGLVGGGISSAYQYPIPTNSHPRNPDSINVSLTFPYWNLGIKDRHGKRLDGREDEELRGIGERTCKYSSNAPFPFHLQ
jgi:hypothetical protein